MFLNSLQSQRQLLKRTWWVALIPILLLVLMGGILAAAANAVLPLLQVRPDFPPEVLALLALLRGPVYALIIIAAVFAFLLVFTYFLSFLHWRAVALREQLDHEKTSFVRMAADTIRTPLTGLRWLTELLLANDLGSMNAEQKESVTNMDRAIQRLITLVNELLNVMRLSGGIIHYHPKPSDVNTVIKGTIEDVKNIAAAKYQTVGFGGLSRDSAMTMDEPLIRHLLTTLITNAIRFAPVREPIVVHAEPKSGEMVIGITYKGEAVPFKSVGEDGGVGMVAQDQEIADDPLNLTISWEILAAAKGRFWVRDEGQEHTLFIALPQGK
jgi:signal transduction histidine kinase